MARSVAARTTVVVLAVLLAVLGSTLLSATLAVFVIVLPLAAAALTRATMVTVALPAAARLPRVAVTVPPACVAVPWLAVAETKLRPAGSTSVTTALWAVLGPALATVSV